MAAILTFKDKLLFSAHEIELWQLNKEKTSLLIF